MAGSVVISKNNVWTVGSHYFHPIMELMKSECLAAGYPHDEIDALFSPLDEGFEHISIDDSISYFRCVSICNKLLNAIKDGSVTTVLDKVVLKSCLEDLLAQLKGDARYSKVESQP